MPPHNPFIFESPVTGPHFIGREREVNLVLDRISNHSRGSIALAGERRIGKTSLLHTISSSDVISRWNMDTAKSIFVYLDCGSIPRFSMSQFWQTVLRKLNQQLKRIADTESLRSTIATLVNGPDIVTQDIEFLLDDLDEAGWVWVLSLDEFEWLIRLDIENESLTRDLLGGLRALMNHVPRVLSLIVATRQPLHELCQDIRCMGSPFYNSFVYVHLRPFQADEAERLLAQRLDGTSVWFTTEERAFLYTLAGRHPLLLQAAAFCLFNAKAADGDSSDLASIREQFASLVGHQFEDLWRWSTPREKLLLLALALDDPSSVGWLLRWAHERESLSLRGLIAESKNQGLRLFSEVFRQWLLDNDYRLLDDGFKRWAKDKGHGQWLVEYAYLPPVSTGQVQPPQATKPKAPVIFISYSHQDRKYKDALAQHLRVLQGSELVEQVWDDALIAAGEDWEMHIGQAIAKAQVAIFLISADALNSDFIRRKEIPELLRRRQEEGLLLMPVITRPCAWKTVEWLRKLQVRPVEGKPLSRDADRFLDEDLAALAEEVARLLGFNI